MDLLGAAKTVELREQVGDSQARPTMVHSSEASDVSLFDRRLKAC
jgi:hypothetical protein